MENTVIYYNVSKTLDVLQYSLRHTLQNLQIIS